MVDGVQQSNLVKGGSRPSHGPPSDTEAAFGWWRARFSALSTLSASAGDASCLGKLLVPGGLASHIRIHIQEVQANR